MTEELHYAIAQIGPALVHPDATFERMELSVWNTPVQELLEELFEHHPDSSLHCLRVAALSIDIALDSNVTTRYLRFIAQGAALHDIGKVDVPCSILDKPEALTTQELMIALTHPYVGAKNIRSRVPGREIGDIVLYHHQLPHRFSGSPLGQAVEIVRAADVGDALEFPRPYNRRMPSSAIPSELAKAYRGDPVYAEAILRRFGHTPLVNVD